MTLKIPPPLIMIFAGVLMWFVANGAFGFVLTGWVGKAFAVLFALDGFLVVVLAIVQFKKHQTTVDPIDPTGASSLVTTGIYRYTRNPMYLGLALFLTAWGCYLGSVTALVLGLVFFVFYINTFQIAREELALNTLFGEEYAAYCQQVRRWFGRY